MLHGYLSLSHPVREFSLLFDKTVFRVVEYNMIYNLAKAKLNSLFLPGRLIANFEHEAHLLAVQQSERTEDKKTHESQGRDLIEQRMRSLDKLDKYAPSLQETVKTNAGTAEYISRIKQELLQQLLKNSSLYVSNQAGKSHEIQKAVEVSLELMRKASLLLNQCEQISVSALQRYPSNDHTAALQRISIITEFLTLTLSNLHTEVDNKSPTLFTKIFWNYMTEKLAVWQALPSYLSRKEQMLAERNSRLEYSGDSLYQSVKTPADTSEYLGILQTEIAEFVPREKKDIFATKGAAIFEATNNKLLRPDLTPNQRIAHIIDYIKTMQQLLRLPPDYDEELTIKIGVWEGIRKKHSQQSAIQISERTGDKEIPGPRVQDSTEQKVLDKLEKHGRSLQKNVETNAGTVKYIALAKQELLKIFRANNPTRFKGSKLAEFVSPLLDQYEQTAMYALQKYPPNDPMAARQRMGVIIEYLESIRADLLTIFNDGRTRTTIWDEITEKIAIWQALQRR